ncbi:MAG: amidohydrolase [Bacillota bacterium]
MTIERLLFRNAVIHTLDRANPTAEALVAENGIITHVGDLPAEKAGFTHIDLGGCHVYPGFIDSHVHFMEFAKRQIEVDLEGVSSLTEALELVRAASRQRGPGEWILGGGWNKNRWGAGDFPTRWMLDSVAPDNPVALFSKDGHTLWANSLAMKVAGVTKDTPIPLGGDVEREKETLELTGIFKETASKLITDKIQASSEDLTRVLEKGIAAAHSRGVVGIHNCEGEQTLRALQSLRIKRGELGLRVIAHIPVEALESAISLGISSGFGDGFLKIGSVKVFADGSLGSQTADMLEPYEGRGTYRGIAVTAADDLERIIKRAARAGFSVAVHAIGDRANRNVLNAFASARRETGKALRHRIEHAQLVHPRDIPRFGELEIIASVQPTHCPSDREIADRHWGARSRYAYAFKSLLRAGARLTLGSDAPVEALDPVLTIYSAVNRKLPDQDEPWYPEERLTQAEAVWAHTFGPVYASGDEHLAGTLAVGKRADMTVLTQDILTCPSEEILDCTVYMTVVDGKIVYSREE